MKTMNVLRKPRLQSSLMALRLVSPPILVETAQQYTEVRIGKAKMHVPGRCRAIKKQHQFETYPTTHFFSEGTLVLTKEGKIEAAELASLIDLHFRSNP